jgi:UDP-N-acetylglucosamine--N-acetylmuramyl-(pentapeptide) pyrophosphoryl-undecaprenol N-acetylglucosamine transferase
MKIAFTGGGTGGHVYPGLALIPYLQAEDATLEFIWIGQCHSIEEELLANEKNIAFHGIHAGKLRRYFSFKNFTDLFQIIQGFFDACSILRQERPNLIFSKGGFVAVPTVWAAKIYRIPVFIHESDYALGLANKMSAPIAEQIFITYEQAKTLAPAKWRAKMTVSGSPVRQIIAQGNRVKGRKKWLKTDQNQLMLVMGGSQGAAQINDLVLGYASQKPSTVHIVHQMGSSLYQPSSIDGYSPFAYINDGLADLIVAADLVVSRAGAGAINELGTLAAPTLLMPLKGHQTKNAQLLAEQGACEVIYQNECDQELFNNRVNKLLADQPKRHHYGKELHKIVHPEAASFLAKQILFRLNMINSV